MIVASRSGGAVPWPLPAGIKSVDIDGYPVAYQEAGAGPPLVLVHGSLGDFRVWAAQVPDFARQHRVFAISLRHYFPEPWDGRGGRFSIAQHAKDVCAFIAALELGKVNLVGHSRGGTVALVAAARRPQAMRSLILADASGSPSLLPDTPEGRATARERELLFESLRKNLESGDTERAAREFADALGGPGTWAKRTPEQKQIALDNMATALDPQDDPGLSAEDVAGFAFPVCLLCGERSPKRFYDMAAALRRCNSRIAEPRIIPNAAHAMHRENPADFNRAVLDFLSAQAT
jgi:pimeloyl-ACP methyl ester carboxylesterase